MKNQWQHLSSLAFCGILLVTPTQCFSQLKVLGKVDTLSTRGDIHVRFANEREDFIPETSFGAEVVPEGQRPVNEYLEMRRSPLFEWASNEVGTKGVRCRWYYWNYSTLLF
jgi:hypothetical protein